MDIVRGWQAVADPDGEEDRIGSVVAGNRLELERLLTGCEGALFALCRRMLGHAEDAEDAVQETFLRAIRNIRRFHRRSQLRTWLYRIAVNICLDQLRRRRPVELLDDLYPVPSGVSVEGRVVGAVRLEQALLQLPGRRRAAFLLKEADGWSAAEIAEILGCRTTTVYYELKEAYRALALLLGQDRCEGE